MIRPNCFFLVLSCQPHIKARFIRHTDISYGISFTQICSVCYRTMADFDGFENIEHGSEDPAADFLAREQSDLGELGDEFGFSRANGDGSNDSAESENF